MESANFLLGPRMATAEPSVFLRRLTRGMAAETLTALADRQLVEQFLNRRDESAFEAILRRHGPMVYRVCWRVLQQTQDSEDAFQATFLLLAQKLRTLRKLDSLASWLHGVAHRVSLKACARAKTARLREDKARTPEVLPNEDISWRELRAVLDAELEKLPEKWRLPLVLCYLEGQTQDEAAARAGWSKNTLRRRLNEAREALGRRLKRRAVLVGSALAGVLLADCASPAAVPAGLAGSIVDAAARLAAGQAPLTSLAPAHVAALTEGVITPMFVSKFKIAVVLGLLVLTLAGAGLSVLGQPSPAAEPGQEKKQPPAVRSEKNQPPLATKPSEDNDPRKILVGRWDKTDPNDSGEVKLSFKNEEDLNISWVPPHTHSGRGLWFKYHLAEKDGNKVLVIENSTQWPVLKKAIEVPYRLDGNALTFDGRTFDISSTDVLRVEQSGSFIRFDFKGTWKRRQDSAQKLSSSTPKPVAGQAQPNSSPAAAKASNDTDLAKALLGWWAVPYPKESGQIMLRFEEQNKIEMQNKLAISWQPPKGFASDGATRSVIVFWELAEQNGGHVMIIRGGVRTLVVPFQLSGDRLSLRGELFECTQEREGRSESYIKVPLKGTWERMKDNPKPRSKGFSFEARICQGDALSDVRNIIGSLSGACVPNSGGWFRIHQGEIKEIDGEQIIGGYLMCTNFEPAEDGKVRLRLTLQHVGVEEDSKQETVVRSSYKQYDRAIGDGETVQLRFGKSAPRDVWLQLRVKEDK